MSEMEDHNDDRNPDPEQLKWDKAGPRQASERKGGAEGNYNEGSEAVEGDPETTSRTIRTKISGDQRGSGASQQGMSESLGGPDGGTNAPSTSEERRFGGSHTAGTSVKRPESREWKGGTPEQGPTSGGMGAAGGGHNTDETDVWKKK